MVHNIQIIVERTLIFTNNIGYITYKFTAIKRLFDTLGTCL